MAANIQPIQYPHVPFHLRRPGYWRCRQVLRRLHEFQDLVRHRERWAPDIEIARPLEELLPKGTDISPANGFRVIQLIERQINRLIPIVSRNLLRGGINTRIRCRVRNHPQDEWREVDLVLGYFERLPDGGQQERYERLMRCLEAGIGVYEERQRGAKRDSLNPVHWLALILRLPITIMESAGLITTHEEHSRFVRVYAWLMQVVMLLLLIMLATKLGISIPWGGVLKAVK